MRCTSRQPKFDKKPLRPLSTENAPVGHVLSHATDHIGSINNGGAPGSCAVLWLTTKFIGVTRSESNEILLQQKTTETYEEFEQETTNSHEDTMDSCSRGFPHSYG